MERELRSQAQWAAACAIGRFFKKTYKQARAVMIDAAQLQRELGSNPARSSLSGLAKVRKSWVPSAPSFV